MIQFRLELAMIYFRTFTYNVTPIGNDMYEVIDMGDQTGYVAGDQFITPHGLLEWEGLKMDGLAGTHPLNK